MVEEVQTPQPAPVQTVATAEDPVKNRRNWSTIVAVGLLSTFALAGAYYFGFLQSQQTQPPVQPEITQESTSSPEVEEQVLCTMDAKQCPDGSYVGRSGPNCEFDPCPGEIEGGAADTQTFSNPEFGVSFNHPQYPTPPVVQGNMITVQSPLNEDRSRGFQLQDGELKVEIIKTEGKSDLMAFVEELQAPSEEETISSVSETTLGGEKAVRWTSQGLGDAEVVAAVHNGIGYTIRKYPAQTSRQQEFDLILSSFTFLN